MIMSMHEQFGHAASVIRFGICNKNLEAVGGVSLAHVESHHTHCYLRLVGIDKHYDYAYLNLLYYIFVFGVMMIICLNSKIRIYEKGC